VSTLRFNAKHCRRHTSGTILSSTTSDRDGSPRLPTKRSSRDAERRGSGIHRWLMHDGAPAHCLPVVRQFWNSLLPEHRTEQCGAHHRGNICSLQFVLQHWQQRTQNTAAGALQLVRQRTAMNSQSTGALFCTSEMSHGLTAHKLL
jgi:hypothetical protein